MEQERTSHSIIDDIRIRTELLESLDWDEELLDSLVLYISHGMTHMTHPNIMIENISMHYTPESANIISDLFDEVYGKLEETINRGFLDGEH